MVELLAMDGMWRASPAPTDQVEIIDPMDPRCARVQRVAQARELKPGDRCRFRGFLYRVAKQEGSRR